MTGVVADVPISLILIFALGAMGIYAFVVGGWASESKYSLLGSMRTVRAARLLRGLARARGPRRRAHVGDALADRDRRRPSRRRTWYIGPQIVGFVCFFIAGIAETNRAPFDLPEAEQELVAGYHTEYGGMRFGLFQMAEYINMITFSGARA